MTLEERLSGMWRECRHNPCLMTPLSALVFLFMLILLLINLALQAPTFLLGLLLSPLISRGNWLVQFLYPSGIARWGHLLILKMGSKGKNGVKLDENGNTLPMHSRAIEQRTEVVKGRVYIHCLPQLLDNVGYLIVCVPPRRNRTNVKKSPPLLGILVDCGDAASVIDQIELIRDVHYANLRCNEIEIHALLCTHKHHDHTGGNKGLLRNKKIASTLRNIYGGAVEKVPYCTKKVVNGEYINLPSVQGNDMGKLVEIECVAVPSHTRGSIVYALRNKSDDVMLSPNKPEVVSYLFTGDAMFSGGGGVPFESDLDFSKTSSTSDKTVHTRFKPNSGSLSVERCFAEVLRRAVKDEDAVNSQDGLAIRQMMVFPGHEYTLELLARQMQPSNMEGNQQWNSHHPSVFFELASQYFISGHRRNLPRSTRLLTVPSPMRSQLKINPYFRSLRKRGELLLAALTMWYKHVHDEKKSKMSKFNGFNADMTQLSMPFAFSMDESIRATGSNMTEKSPSSENTWNTNINDFNRSVFTTVYTSDFDEIVDAMKSGRIGTKVAAKKLMKLSGKLDNPVVVRRPIPSTLPSEKKMYMGLLALAALGSPPSALSAYDSEIMEMPSPITATDRLLISKKRLISVLFRLGLLPSGSSISGIDQIVLIINLLWDEARLDFNDLKSEREQLENGIDDDLIQLGALKLTLFAVAYNQPSWFKKYCMPCHIKPKTVLTSKLKRSGGELVKHDVMKCQMCVNALGCPKDNGALTDDDDLSFDDTISDYASDHDIEPQQKRVQLVENAPPTPNSNNEGNIEVRAVRGFRSRKKVTKKTHRSP